MKVDKEMLSYSFNDNDKPFEENNMLRSNFTCEKSIRKDALLVISEDIQRYDSTLDGCKKYSTVAFQVI